MMDNIPNLRLEVLIDYVLTKRNVWTTFHDNTISNPLVDLRSRIICQNRRLLLPMLHHDYGVQPEHDHD